MFLKEELEEIFDILDYDQKNRIDIEDLKETLATLGYETTMTTLYNLLSFH